MTPTEIKAYGRSYTINNPGSGRVGSKLNLGIPYEKLMLQDIYQHHFTGVAFDIGAHIGNHTLYLAAVCGLQVYAWEPYPSTYQLLLDNIALNPTLDIIPFDWACGDRVTRGRFTQGMWIEFDPTREGDKLKLDRGEVPVYPIDAKLTVPNLSVVKVDVEGMEAQVLTGMVDHLGRSLPTVYTEAHTDEDKDKISAILTPLGYEITRILHMGSRQIRWQHPTKVKP